MSANRAFFCIALTAYIEIRHIGPASLGLVFLSAGLTMTGMIFAHVVIYPASNTIRRTIALIADLATLCTVMHFCDEEGVSFYPLILWTVFGNGFRFGLTALRVAIVTGFIAFLLVAMTTPFWREHISIAVGLGLGTLVLPAYAAALIKSLTQARQRAEAANEIKGTFLANVSHELRTPLQALLGTTDLLRKTQLSVEQNELVQITSTASQTLLLMINDVLSFTGLNVKEVEPEFTDTNPVYLLQDVVNLSIPACKAKQLRLGLHVSLDIPTSLQLDARHVREVLLNLVGNAVKFTDKGGILVSADTTKAGDAVALRFSVTDTGIGIADDAKDKVFERFTQANGKIAQRYGGTGLGLAICRHLVERMRGRIGVHDSIQGGSVFWFEVPVRLTQDLEEAKGSSHAEVRLLVTDGIAVGRFARMCTDQGRPIRTSLGDDPSRLVEALRSQENGQIVALQGSVFAQSRNEFDSVLSQRMGTTRRPVIFLEDHVSSQQGQNWDPRWIAAVNLPPRFTDEQLYKALRIADYLVEDKSDLSPLASVTGAVEQLKILIVDDNRTNRLIYSRVLESTGYLCQMAVNGEQALDALVETEFNLVLMDVNMPGIDGLEATKLQRVAELGMGRVPIIGITADASPEMEKKCLSAGMNACLIKPVSSAALLGLVADLLSDVLTKPLPPAAIIPAKERGTTADIDWQPLDGLTNVGGPDFLREVLTEFVRDSRDLLGELRVAVALGQSSQIREMAHAIASTSANVGAVRVRTLAREFERLPAALSKVEGVQRTAQLRDAIKTYLAALADVVGEDVGRRMD